MFVMDKLNLAQNKAFFGHLDNYNDHKTEKQVFQTLKREHQIGELSFKSYRIFIG